MGILSGFVYFVTIVMVATQEVQPNAPDTTQTSGVQGCRPMADVIFLLDGSDSISDQEFLQQKQFVRRFIELSDIGPWSIRVGLAVVSSKIGDELPLSLNASKATLLAALDGISQPQEGSRTDIGLVEMEQLFSTNSRRGVARIGVVITDGRAKYVKATEGEARVVKDSGVFLIAVGVGRLIQFSELEKIASTKSNAYNLDPLELSTRYLAETVDFQGLESCTGNLLIDTLGIPPDKKPDMHTMEGPAIVQEMSSASGIGPRIKKDSSSAEFNTINGQDTNKIPAPSASLPSNQLDLSSAVFKKMVESAKPLANKMASPSEISPKRGLGISAPGQGEFKYSSSDLLGNTANLVPDIQSEMGSVYEALSNNLREQANSTSGTITEGSVFDQTPHILTMDSQSSKLSSIPKMNNVQMSSTDSLGSRNFLGLKMQPFMSIGRFSAINPFAPEIPVLPIDPPSAPPVQPVVVTTQAPRSRPQTTAQPITTTPEPFVQSSSTLDRGQNSFVQRQSKGPSPSETADLMIKNLMASVSDNAKPGAEAPRSNVAIEVFNNPGLFNNVGREGVGIRIPETSVADSLAILKAARKPGRTVEEITNPIYQFFEMSTTAPTKPMTTTVSPEQMYQQRTSMLLKDHCATAHFDNGVAYIVKPGSCSEFLKCYRENGVMNFNMMKCPFETFFDDQQFVCRHHTEQMCWNDPCADRSLTSYGHFGNCRAHWTCVRGKSVPTCCPLGTSYVNGLGCGRNITCTDSCMDFGDLRTVTMNSRCKMLAVEDDKNSYFEHVAGMGWVVRSCAPGSNFDQSRCSCSSTEKQIADLCEPQLYLDFQGEIADKSKNSLAMGIYNVDLDGSTGAFYGKSHLKLWRFSGMSLGQHVTISFRFRTSVTAKKGKLMHIVSNCCYTCPGVPKPSLDIAIIPSDKGGVAVFSTTTMEAGEMFLFVPYRDTFTGWNRLEFSYNGLSVTGKVNGMSASKKMLGNIVGKPDPLLIGSCGVDNAYEGLIDEFKFYMCNP